MGLRQQQQFYFVVGGQAACRFSHTLLDAWFKVEQSYRTGELGCEFGKEANNTIEAWSLGGKLEAKTWEQWHDALMTDTYGTDWEARIESAAKLMQ